MLTYSTPRSSPITLSASTESFTYALFGIAMALTTLGVYFGIANADTMFSTGTLMLCTILEFGLLLTSGLWANRSPLNVVLFLAFPLLSGITVAPYILMVLTGYANGGAILLNALGATATTALACAVLARSGVDMRGWIGALVFGLIGLILFGLVQLFVPSLRTGTVEIFVSGFAILLFAGFTAYDLQRIQGQGRAGGNPFLLALSLYLDIFNLFLTILRFMTAVSGRRD
jgi:FtsH-binding integral membrane protein